MNPSSGVDINQYQPRWRTCFSSVCPCCTLSNKKIAKFGKIIKDFCRKTARNRASSRANYHANQNLEQILKEAALHTDQVFSQKEIMRSCGSLLFQLLLIKSAPHCSSTDFVPTDTLCTAAELQCNRGAPPSWPL